MKTVYANRYDTGEAIAVQIEAGVIVAIAPSEHHDSLPLIAPGLADWQVNGYGGIAFNDPRLTIEQVRRVCEHLTAFGVTSFLPTLTTTSEDDFIRGCAIIASAVASDAVCRRRIAGIHIEGPFIAPDDGPRGAHPLEHVRPPNIPEFERWQAAAGGFIRLVTLSPEYDSSPEFIAHLTRNNVLAAIGHTQANSAQIAAAVEAGARLSTHLGNGSHLTLKRHPNYIWDQLAEDRLMASLIADGHHLSPAVLKSMLRAKTPARCILVSDCVDLAGCAPGRYQTALGEVELLPEGRLVVAGQREMLAGASLPLSTCVARVVTYGGVTPREAIDMASVQPRSLLGCSRSFLAIGEPADFFLVRIQRDDLMIFGGFAQGDAFGSLME